MNNAVVGIIMGSDSDMEVMAEASKIFKDFKIPYEMTIVSAHRTPERMFEYAKSSVSRGLKIIIAGAGGSAHLPGMTASLTPLPVIGVPINTKSLKGLDSLLSINQMPPGVPVATMAINGTKNAALLAISILGIHDKNLQSKMVKYKNDLRKSVEKKARQVIKLNK